MPHGWVPRAAACPASPWGSRREMPCRRASRPPAIVAKVHPRRPDAPPIAGTRSSGSTTTEDTALRSTGRSWTGSVPRRSTASRSPGWGSRRSRGSAAMTSCVRERMAEPMESDDIERVRGRNASSSSIASTATCCPCSRTRSRPSGVSTWRTRSDIAHLRRRMGAGRPRGRVGGTCSVRPGSWRASGS